MALLVFFFFFLTFVTFFTGSSILTFFCKNSDFSSDLKYNITSIGTWGARIPPIVEQTKDQVTYWTSHRENFPSNKDDVDIVVLEKNEISISPIYPKFSNEEFLNKSFNLKKK